MCNNQKGQTLVEALLSVAVAVIVVVALVGVGITAMRSANFGRDQAEAVRQAGQTMEILRSIRDSNWTSFNSSMTSCTSLAPCCLNGSGAVIPYLASSCLVNSVYDTSFSASIDGGTGYITVTNHVKFNEGQITRDVTLTQTFTNWRT